MALSSFLGVPMSLRISLAAVLRLARRAKGLKIDDYQNYIDPKHVNNLENAKVNPGLETLEAAGRGLGCDTVALIVLAASLDQSRPFEQYLEELQLHINELRKLGIEDGYDAEIKNGQLVPRSSGARMSPDKVKAIIACKQKGMSQKETSKALEIPTSTVNRIWNSAN